MMSHRSEKNHPNRPKTKVSAVLTERRRKDFHFVFHPTKDSQSTGFEENNRVRDFSEKGHLNIW